MLSILERFKSITRDDLVRCIMANKKITSSKTKKKKKVVSAKVSRDLAMQAHFERNKRARCVDENEWSKDVREDADIDWIRHPERSDVIGIDIPTEIDDNRKMIVSKKIPRKCTMIKKGTMHKGNLINPSYIPDDR